MPLSSDLLLLLAPPTVRIAEQGLAHLGIQTLHQPARRVDERPDHARQLLRALRLVVGAARCGGIGVFGLCLLLLLRIRGVQQRDLPGRLEDCARTPVQRDGRLDAGLLGKAAESLLEGIGAVGLWRREDGMSVYAPCTPCAIGR